MARLLADAVEENRERLKKMEREQGKAKAVLLLVGMVLVGLGTVVLAM